jgi:uncharacterized repeat protein (TIGR01451 family)
MIKKLKILKKIVAIYIAFLLAVNPLFVRVAWAEESGEIISPEATNEVEVGEVEEQSNTNEEKETAVEEEGENEGKITVDTGDGVAVIDVDTGVNNNEVVVEGELTASVDPCESPDITTDCPDGLEVEIENEADVDLSAEALAGTGDNQIEADGSNAATNTGEAAAAIDSTTQTNTNKVVLEDSEDDPVVNELNGVVDNSDDPAVGIVLNNQGEVVNLADSEADSGDNTTKDASDVIINTGDAVAWINLINYLNANFIGSQIEFLFLDLIEEDFVSGSSEINLNEVWRSLLEKEAADGTDLVENQELAQMDATIRNLNQAVLENDLTVSAETGQNEVSDSDNVAMSTGDATALANVFNLVNVNVLGSQLLFFTINIFGTFDGDLVLPRPENFTSTEAPEESESKEESSKADLVLNNDNMATVDNNVLVEAETGENEVTDTGGETEIDTGEAQAIANVLSLINTNISQNDWFYLILNVLGDWTGKILGWSSPEASESYDGETTTFQTGSGSQNNNSANGESEYLTTICNINEAEVENNINVSASTGENTASNNKGDVSIKTGTATALANLFNLVNLNIMGGRLFFGTINILGNWTGDLIFAYPDVAVNLHNGNGELRPGDVTSYTLSYQNNGYDPAKDTQLELQLPEGMNFLSHSSSLPFNINDNKCQWQIDNLSPGEGGVIKIYVQVDDNFSFEEKPTLSEMLVRPVHAAELKLQKEIITTASIGTVNPESDSSNNQAQVATIIYDEEPESSGSSEDTENGVPALEVQAQNNVGEFVYPGDIVTFELSVRNAGDGKSENTYILQGLYSDASGIDYGVGKFEVGTIQPGKSVTIRFGLQLADSGIYEAGQYYTLAQAVGYSTNGDEVVSNEASTDFMISLKYLDIMPKAEAKEEDGQVLAQSDELDLLCPEEDENIIPYVLLFLTSSLYIIHRVKKARLVKIDEKI